MPRDNGLGPMRSDQDVQDIMHQNKVNEASSLRAENQQLKKQLATANKEIDRLKRENAEKCWKDNPDRMGS